jgi:hypothetical protein
MHAADCIHHMNKTLVGYHKIKLFYFNCKFVFYMLLVGCILLVTQIKIPYFAKKSYANIQIDKRWIIKNEIYLKRSTVAWNIYLVEQAKKHSSWKKQLFISHSELPTIWMKFCRAEHVISPWLHLHRKPSLSLLWRQTVNFILHWINWWCRKNGNDYFMCMIIQTPHSFTEKKSIPVLIILF